MIKADTHVQGQQADKVCKLNERKRRSQQSERGGRLKISKAEKMVAVETKQELPDVDSMGWRVFTW